MMKSYSISIGLRSLFERRKQYAPLFLVCMFGMGLSVFSLFLMRGMLFSLSLKAKIYYGGDYQFIGGSNALEFYEPEVFVDQLKKIFPREAVVTQRIDHGADASALYFEGTGVRMRVVKGCDFETEKDLFSKFTYVQGSASGMTGSNGVLLSKPIADMLCATVGDELTYMLRTNQGYLNTVTLVVQGIFQDSSLFGMYTSYVDKKLLQREAGYPENFSNRICIFFPAESPGAKETNFYQSQLEKVFPMFPQTESKQFFYDRLLTGQLPSPTYALVKLSANMNELNSLIFAMQAIIAFIIATLSVIITVGISSAYRVMVLKRINEIGIYMALGMSRPGIYRTLLAETFALLVTGLVSGFLFGGLLLKVVSHFDFSSIPAFDVFLTDGRLFPFPNFPLALALAALIIVSTTAAVFLSARKAVHTLPANALGMVV